MRGSTHTFILEGVDAAPCRVEAAVINGRTPRTTVVGLPDAAVREAVDRVQAAMEVSGLKYPEGRVTINLSPASHRKEGPSYDLPIAIALMLAGGMLDRAARSRAADCLFAGELRLDGGLAAITGGVAMADLAARSKVGTVILPFESAGVAALVGGVRVLSATSLLDVVQHLAGGQPLPPAEPMRLLRGSADVDLADVRGQALPRRALAVAAAGWHNLLMVGPPGTGKTTLARCLPGILPPPSPLETLEMARVASVVGAVPSRSRPFRSPHHTASAAAIVGGGARPRPGEITLAHHGVLFLDELPEFARPALEALREPLERDEVRIARAGGRVCFPARVLLVAAMNPTRSGHGRPGSDGSLHRLSGPLLDRIDLHVEVPSVPIRMLSGEGHGQSSEVVRKRILTARRMQRNRQGGVLNGRLSSRQLDAWAVMRPGAEAVLQRSVEDLGLSARAWDRLRRVARTLADLDELDVIEEAHVAEAVQFRWLDRS
ncbi:MAG: YifB family Mg chelatase-like AAA ATPase [Phycisphaerales bacterium]|jgi:magnesium chelatase family protein|nr:YifB family Mg chelatase-like AAA ATPase [Phycisphaerales bacterium]